jgi:hypothetical protein
MYWPRPRQALLPPILSTRRLTEEESACRCRIRPETSRHTQFDQARCAVPLSCSALFAARGDFLGEIPFRNMFGDPPFICLLSPCPADYALRVLNACVCWMGASDVLLAEDLVEFPEALLMNVERLESDGLRAALVAVAIEWERRYGVSPAITGAISEYDAARIVGHTAESFGLDCAGRTAVTRGSDFCHNNNRYQVKANRPSGKPGSFVTLVSRAKNYDWDRLIWLLYDRDFRIQEAWEWAVSDYQERFDRLSRLSPAHMRQGRRLPLPASTGVQALVNRNESDKDIQSTRLP